MKRPQLVNATQAELDELLRLALRAGFSGRGARLHIGSSNLVNHALPLFTFYGKD